MTRPDWDSRYRSGDTPWDTGEPSQHLVDFVSTRCPTTGHALEVGCGTGTNALWLAAHGFSVLGVDISPIALDQARAKVAGSSLQCRFETQNFLVNAPADGPFDFVFDLGCFHVFVSLDERRCFAEQVRSVLRPGGRWLSLIGSTEGPARNEGPPRRSARDVIESIEPSLEILELRSIEFRANAPSPAAAWLCVSGPRKVPAQPPTPHK